MLPSVRKELEELEARLDLMLGKQAELETALSALRVHLGAVMQGETNNLDADITLKFQEQSKWLASTLSNLRIELLEQNALDKSETVAAVAGFETRGHRQTESLRAQVAEHFKATQAQNEELLRRLDEFETQARRDSELEIDDVSPQSLTDWGELVGARLKRFGETQGMPRSFAWQLLQEFKELTDLNRQIGDESGAGQNKWDDRLDELQRVLFAADRTMPWTVLTPHNATAAQRRELRDLETAVAQLRSHAQENLLSTTGIRPLEIVPRVSPFDASVHESNEFLEAPTTDASKHNLILSVEQMGFQKLSPWGDAQLLRPARVRRYVLREEEASSEEVAPETAAKIAIESEVPRVSGQL